VQPSSFQGSIIQSLEEQLICSIPIPHGTGDNRPQTSLVGPQQARCAFVAAERLGFRKGADGFADGVARVEGGSGDDTMVTTQRCVCVRTPWPVVYL
jgi:hypothetical protein